MALSVKNGTDFGALQAKFGGAANTKKVKTKSGHQRRKRNGSLYTKKKMELKRVKQKKSAKHATNTDVIEYDLTATKSRDEICIDKDDKNAEFIDFKLNKVQNDKNNELFDDLDITDNSMQKSVSTSATSSKLRVLKSSMRISIDFDNDIDAYQSDDNDTELDDISSHQSSGSISSIKAKQKAKQKSFDYTSAFFGGKLVIGAVTTDFVKKACNNNDNKKDNGLNIPKNKGNFINFSNVMYEESESDQSYYSDDRSYYSDSDVDSYYSDDIDADKQSINDKNDKNIKNDNNTAAPAVPAAPVVPVVPVATPAPAPVAAATTNIPKNKGNFIDFDAFIESESDQSYYSDDSRRSYYSDSASYYSDDEQYSDHDDNDNDNQNNTIKDNDNIDNNHNNDNDNDNKDNRNTIPVLDDNDDNKDTNDNDIPASPSTSTDAINPTVRTKSTVIRHNAMMMDALLGDLDDTDDNIDNKHNNGNDNDDKDDRNQITVLDDNNHNNDNDIPSSPSTSMDAINPTIRSKSTVIRHNRMMMDALLSDLDDSDDNIDNNNNDDIVSSPFIDDNTSDDDDEDKDDNNSDNDNDNSESISSPFTDAINPTYRTTKSQVIRNNKNMMDTLMGDLDDDDAEEEEESESESKEELDMMSINELMEDFRLSSYKKLNKYFISSLNIQYARELVNYKPTKIIKPPKNIVSKLKVLKILNKLGKFVANKVINNWWDGTYASKWAGLISNQINQIYTPKTPSTYAINMKSTCVSPHIVFEKAIDNNSNKMTNKIQLIGHRQQFIDKIINISEIYSITIRIDKLPITNTFNIGVMFIDSNNTKVCITDRLQAQINDLFHSTICFGDFIENGSEISIIVNNTATKPIISFSHCTRNDIKSDYKEIVMGNMKKASKAKIYIEQFTGDGVYIIKQSNDNDNDDNNDIHDNIDNKSWKCINCKEINFLKHKFCPQCGNKQ